MALLTKKLLRLDDRLKVSQSRAVVLSRHRGLLLEIQSDAL